MTKTLRDPEELKIHPEFAELLPRHSQEELERLEDSMVDHGLLSPIVTWNDYILDGYVRYTLCKHHGIGIETVDINKYRDMSEEEAKIYRLQTLMDRRNLTTYSKLELSRKLKNLIEHKEKQELLAWQKAT